MKARDVEQYQRGPCSSSGGSLHSSAALLHASAISRLICSTTASMLRLTTMSRLHRAAIPPRCVNVMPHSCVDQCIDIRAAHQFAFLLHQAQLQHLGLDRDVVASASARGDAAVLAPQVSQIGNPALIEREAVTLPLDHAFGFQLADVGPAAIEVQRQCRCADGRGRPLATAGPSMVTISVIVFVPVASR